MTDRPNILFITTDTLGRAMCSAYGDISHLSSRKQATPERPFA